MHNFFMIALLLLLAVPVKAFPPFVWPCSDATSASDCTGFSTDSSPCAWCGDDNKCVQFPGCDVTNGVQPSAWASGACSNGTAGLTDGGDHVCDGTTNVVNRDGVIGSLCVAAGLVALFSFVVIGTGIVVWRRRAPYEDVVLRLPLVDEDDSSV